MSWREGTKKGIKKKLSNRDQGGVREGVNPRTKVSGVLTNIRTIMWECNPAVC